MKKVLSCLIAAVLLAGLFMGCAPKREQIVLKSVVGSTMEHPIHSMYFEYVKRINETSNGEIFIDVVGASDSIPTQDQPEAVRTGVVDIISTDYNQSRSIWPEVEALVLHSPEHTLVDLRKAGFYDLMAESALQANLVFLGEGSSPSGIYLGTDFRAEKLEDLAGHTMRGGGIRDAVYKELGIIPINLPSGEIYTAMERGLIEGFSLTLFGITARALGEVTKYVILPSYFPGGNNIVVNLDTWNSLPKRLQDFMAETMLEMEPEIVAHFANVVEGQALQELKDAGVEFIQLPPGDAKRFTEISQEIGWAALQKTVSPEWYSRLKEGMERVSR